MQSRKDAGRMKKKTGECWGLILVNVLLWSHTFKAMHTTAHRHAPYNRQLCTQWVRTANPLVGETWKDLTNARARVNSHILLVVFISASLSFVAQMILLNL